MSRAMRQTLQKIGSSSSSLYSCRRAPSPIPKPNPIIPLSSQFTKIHYNLAEAPREYFYCNTEEFKRMLIEYKSNKKMYSHVMAARIARLNKHRDEDTKLMEKLGVLKKVELGEYEDIDDMDPDEIRKHYEDIADSYKGERREIISSWGYPMCERVDAYPPNPYGISGGMFFLMGPAAGDADC